MNRQQVYRLAKRAAALIVGGLVYVAGYFVFAFMISWFFLYHNPPYPAFYGNIVLMYFVLLNLLAVIAYSITLRLCFARRLRWGRVVVLCLLVLLLNGLQDLLLEAGLLENFPGWLLWLLICFLGGLFILREWVLRPDKREEIVDLVKNFE